MIGREEGSSRDLDLGWVGAERGCIVCTIAQGLEVGSVDRKNGVPYATR
jgi:hypothetical protein